MSDENKDDFVYVELQNGTTAIYSNSIETKIDMYDFSLDDIAVFYKILNDSGNKVFATKNERMVEIAKLLFPRSINVTESKLTFGNFEDILTSYFIKRKEKK